MQCGCHFPRGAANCSSNDEVGLGSRNTSVFVDTKDADTMELGQLGQEDSQQRGCVDYKVHGVILGIKAC